MPGRLTGGSEIIFKRSDAGKGQYIRASQCDLFPGIDSDKKNVEAAN